MATAPPDDGCKLDERTLADGIRLRGDFRNDRDVATDIDLALGADFPEFHLVDSRDGIQLHFAEPLDQAQCAQVGEAVRSLDLPIGVTVVHATPNNRPEAFEFKRWPQGDVDLVPSRRIASTAPRRVRWLVEEDEEYWLAHRERAFLGGAQADPNAFLPEDWLPEGSRCVVDATAFPPENIRTYLSLYDVVTLGLPLGDGFHASLEQLGVTSGELIDLLGTKRVQIALPQSIDRYDAHWLAEAADAYPQAFLASRRFSCAVLADGFRRMPFFAPVFETDEKRELMRLTHSLTDDPDLPDPVRKWFAVLATELVNFWLVAPRAIHREGALQTARFGLGWFASRLFEEFHGEERTLEIMAAATSVQWAGALGATAIPRRIGDYDEENAANFVASLAAPVDPLRIPVADPRQFKALDGLLALDNDIPALEFANDFKGGDIKRFRAILAGIASENQDDDFLNETLNKYNAEVRRYEKRENRLRTYNTAAFISATIAATSATASLGGAAPFVPLGVWLLGVALARGSEPTVGGPVMGRLWDYANGLLALEPPRAVLLSRLRKQVSAMKR